MRLRKQSKKEKACALSHTPWIRFKSIMQTHTVCSTSRPIFTAKTKKSIWKWGLRWSGNIDGQKWSRSSQMEQSEVIEDEKWKDHAAYKMKLRTIIQTSVMILTSVRLQLRSHSELVTKLQMFCRQNYTTILLVFVYQTSFTSVSCTNPYSLLLHAHRASF